MTPRVCDLTTEPEVGRCYRVPCVRASIFQGSRSFWLPILGPPHPDPELGVPHPHWHFDLRFFSEAAADRLGGDPDRSDPLRWGRLLVYVQSTHEWHQPLPVVERRLRCLRPMPTVKQGVTGVFLDPPYAGAGRAGGLYAQDDGEVAREAREWALAQGADSRIRIALCGYQGEHEGLEGAGWRACRWKASGGYGSQGDGRGRENAQREVVWFSPHCFDPARPSTGLFALALEDL